MQVGETRRRTQKAASDRQRGTKTRPELQRGSNHQDQHRSECLPLRILKGNKLQFLKTKVILFSQNIKKKDAGGAKTRPAAGGFLPPPPGAKAAGLIPPPAGQHSFPPVQANNGEA